MSDPDTQISSQPTDLLIRHMSPDAIRIYKLNILKLYHLLPAMLLTVEERRCIEDLVRVWFNGKTPPEMPWTERRMSMGRLRAMKNPKSGKQKLRTRPPSEGEENE